MAIEIPDGRSRTGMALSGADRVRSSRPLAWLTIASFCAVTSVAAALAWLAHGRDVLWTAAVASQQADDIDAASAATDRTVLASRLAWASIALAAFIVAAWSRSLARNAAARGVTGLHPNRTALSWFVPLVGPAAAIRQIGRLVREFDYSERRLWFWLFAFHVYAAIMVAGQIAITIGFNVEIDQSWSAAAVHRQSQVFALQAAMGLVLTLLAMRAVRHADLAVSGVRRRRATRSSTRAGGRQLPGRARRSAVGVATPRARTCSNAA